MEDNWTVKIQEVPGNFACNVFIYRKYTDDKVQVLKGDLIETFDIASAVPPTMMLRQEQLQAFADALNSMGINPTREYTEGKLEATTSHLADLRTLLKLK